MKTAVIYTRVSTDKQAEKGYSLREQEDNLRRYCRQNNYKVIRHFQEDYSAKDFNRPEWKALMDYLVKNKERIDTFMFAKWDRFSRNLVEGLNEWNKIKALGIRTHCLEINVDDSIPENLMMQTILLVFPQIENERRSLNIRAGNHRALKEGRWPRTAPKGYLNTTDEQGNKVIVPDRVRAPLIRQAFHEMSAGNKTQQDIRIELNRKGLNCSKSNFSRMLRNLVYIGKIVVPEYKDQPEEIIDGMHVPIVEEEVFDEVQEILSGRNKKKNLPGKIILKPELPLRGFILCSKCGHKMTGSGSRGNGGRYFYYHCNRCGERLGAERVNREFESLLKKMELTEAMKNVFIEKVKDALATTSKSRLENRKSLGKELEREEKRKQRIEDSFLDGEIEGKVYSELQQKVENRIRKLNQKIKEANQTEEDLYRDLQKGIEYISNVGKVYQQSDVEGKQKITGSIFPRKFVFDDKGVRTDQINEVAGWMIKTNSMLRRNKKGQPMKKHQLSCQVIPPGFEPRS